MRALRRSVVVAVPLALAAAASIAVATRQEEGGSTPSGQEAQATQAVGIFVARSGSDGADGSRARPVRSLDRAVELARPGETVYVRGGRYGRQHITRRRGGTASAPITVRPFPGERVIFDGGADVVTGRNRRFEGAVVWIEGSHVVFQGFDVRRSPGSGLVVDGRGNVVRRVSSHDHWDHGILVKGSGHVVEDSRVTRAAMVNYEGRSGSWPGGLSINAADRNAKSRDITIRRNRIDDVWGEGLAAVHVRGYRLERNVVRDAWSVNIYLDGTEDGVVDGNFSTTTPGRERARRPRGLCWANEPVPTYRGNEPTRDLVIRNNILVGTGAVCYVVARSQLRSNSYYRNVRFIGNTLHDTGFEISATPVGPPRGNLLSNNILEEGATLAQPSAWRVKTNALPEGLTLGDDSVSMAPAFVSPDSATPQGFRLDDGSPLRGRGRGLPDLPRDFFGDVRADPPTIGAVE